MKTLKNTLILPVLLASASLWGAGGSIIDHRHAVLNSIPLEAIQQAKDSLHIAYGMTSHGSQLLSANGSGTQGLNGLRGVSDVFVTSPEETPGALHLLQGSAYEDGESSLLVGDAGWTLPGDDSMLRFVSETRRFLGTPDAQGRGSLRPAYNVVMWSWCGQVSKLPDAVFEHYFSGMDSLEAQYPGVAFVWMTGHLDGTGEDGLLHRRNERLRAYAREHGKWLYDYADLESWDPDGNYYVAMDADDGADYDKGNWAKAWTAAHPGEVDLTLKVEHSEPLVGQIKTIAAWWLFARLAGWNVDPLALRGVEVGNAESKRPAGYFDLLGRAEGGLVNFAR